MSAGRITLWGIEVFLAAAEEGSVSAAARRLGASPSGVSQQLTNLETALGVVLMDRSQRPMQLTPAGHTLRRRAQRILNEAMQARAELAAQDLSQLTDLKIGMIEDFDADVTPRLLAAMAGQLQKCHFLLETGASHRLFDQLEARAIDIAVAADTGEAPADWMEIHPLLEEPYIAAVPKGHFDGEDVTLAALQSLPLIQYTERHMMGRQIAAHLRRQKLRLDHRFELDSYHAIMAMVAAGAGWTILTPLGLLRAHRFIDHADALPLPFEPISRQISLTARAETLKDIPAEIAGTLKELLAELIVAPARERMPWLGDSLRVL